MARYGSTSGGSMDQTANVTTTSQVVLKANWHRSYALLINDSDTTIYLALGYGATTNKGIRLNSLGGSYEITGSNLFQGDIFAVHGGTGNKVLCILEMEQRGNQNA